MSAFRSAPCSLTAIAFGDSFLALLQYLQFHGLDVEGLFRVPGNQDKVLELKSSFEKGESVILMDAHNTAGVLKLYFRELSDPLIPFALYEDALTAAELDCGKAPPAAAVAAVPAGKPGAKPAAAPAAPMSKKELEKLRREQIRDRERKAKELARLEKEKRLRSKKTRTPDKVRQKAAAAAAAAEKQLVPQHRKVGSRPSISSFTFDEPAPRPAAGSAGPAAGAPAATAAAAPVASAAAGAGAATPSLESKESKEKPASTTRFPRLLAFLQRLPPDNYTVLSYLLSFLCNVASKSSINKVNVRVNPLVNNLRRLPCSDGRQELCHGMGAEPAARAPGNHGGQGRHSAVHRQGNREFCYARRAGAGMR